MDKNVNACQRCYKDVHDNQMHKKRAFRLQFGFSCKNREIALKAAPGLLHRMRLIRNVTQVKQIIIPKKFSSRLFYEKFRCIITVSILGCFTILLSPLHFSGFSRRATADLCVAVTTQTFCVTSKTMF